VDVFAQAAAEILRGAALVFGLGGAVEQPPCEVHEVPAYLVEIGHVRILCAKEREV
jgi:hypothetical protein